MKTNSDFDGLWEQLKNPDRINQEFNNAAELSKALGLSVTRFNFKTGMVETELPDGTIEEREPLILKPKER